MAGNIVLAIVVAYFLGSIPCAYIAGRLVKGVDIRQLGGGNVGAVNVMREIGTAAGFTVLFADMAKGALAVLVAQWLGLPLIWVFIVGFIAVVGHNWSVWLRFKGGQGLATTLGILLALVPIEFAISFSIIVIVVLLTSNMRLSVGIGLVFLPLIIWLFGGELSIIAYSIALPLFCSLKMIPRLRTDIAGVGKKNLIVDRQYKPWQRRK
ncbi:MAG: glycerol-3-phosphate acyltransferase [Dehalococcoidia bacterium]|nr:glycerol-3-phosphate acyltransferase [Dehalococcoidia bacterium]